MKGANQTLIAFLLLIFAFTTSNSFAQEAEKNALDQLREDIKTLAAASVCGENNSCYFVGLGAKPCGGFWEYLIYSDSIDVVSLLTKVETLNELEKAYNEKFGIQSDCFMVSPPAEVNCVEGKCLAKAQS